MEWSIFFSKIKKIILLKFVFTFHFAYWRLRLLQACMRFRNPKHTIKGNYIWQNQVRTANRPWFFVFTEFPFWIFFGHVLLKQLLKLFIMHVFVLKIKWYNVPDVGRKRKHIDIEFSFFCKFGINFLLRLAISISHYF